MTIKEIKAFPESGDAFISLLKQDSRQGVRTYAKSLERKRQKEEDQKEKIKDKKRFDDQYRSENLRLVCGIDEVGRGPLAGPVVTAAVILPEDSCIIGIDDSKKLSKSERERLDKIIREEAIAYAYGSISPEHIDEINILNATKKAMVSAVSRLDPRPDLLILDALKLGTSIPEVPVIGGDAKSYTIGAASIIAKVKRDQYMEKMAKHYPEYGFDRNMGYGTKEHIEAIKRYGLTPIHRKSFCKNLI